MSNVKERILGAVTVMSEEDALMVWNLIVGAFNLSRAEEVEPDPEERAAIEAYCNGDPEYMPSVSAEEAMKILGLG